MDDSCQRQFPSLTRLFKPKAVAIVGASNGEDKVTARPLRYLSKFGYDGDLYPVNPNYDELKGIPCYDSVLDIKGAVDVAVVMTDAESVPDILRECGDKGIPFAVVAASGFSEEGPEGERRERELAKIAQEYQIHIVGPNTVGVANLQQGTILSFASIFNEELLRMDEDGTVGVVSQSGAVSGILTILVDGLGLNCKYLVATGNEVDLDSVGVIEFMVADSEISTIVGFVESFKHGAAFPAVAERALEEETPIVLLKVGRSPAAKESIASHTGKMTDEYKVYEHICSDFGIPLAESTTELEDTLQLLTTMSSRTVRRINRPLTIVSSSGGLGTLLADACEKYGLDLADIPADTRAELEETLPIYGSATNPIDLTGQILSRPDKFEAVYTSLMDESVDNLLLQFGNSGGKLGKRYAEMLTSSIRSGVTPCVVVFSGKRPDKKTLQRYRDAGIPVFFDSARAVRAIQNASVYAEALSRESPASEAGGNSLNHPQPIRELAAGSMNVLEKAGLQTPQASRATAPEEAVEIAEAVGYPVVVKVPSDVIDHKTEQGLVHAGLCSPDDVREAARAITNTLEVEGLRNDKSHLLIQEHVDGFETIVGAFETDFGDTITFGTGGVYTEVYEDVSYARLPVTDADVRAMLTRTSAGEVIAGHRSSVSAVESLVDVITTVGDLFLADETMTELEVNPLVVRGEEAIAVDVLMSRSD